MTASTPSRLPRTPQRDRTNLALNLALIVLIAVMAALTAWRLFVDDGGSAPTDTVTHVESTIAMP